MYLSIGRRGMEKKRILALVGLRVYGYIGSALKKMLGTKAANADFNGREHRT